jgi:pimeloyl-ACP methyl ester carboxylesterase
MGPHFTMFVGGQGPAIILIHGFPQDWFEYHAIMPRLAKQFTVIAVDLRGVGGSTAKRGGYDAPTMAEDVHQLAAALKLEHVYVVGHDIGGHVAYAFVRSYPQVTGGAMILDTPIPGIKGGPRFKAIRPCGTSGLCRSRGSQRNLSWAGRPTTSATSSNSANLHSAKWPITSRLTALLRSFTPCLKCIAHFLLVRNSI